MSLVVLMIVARNEGEERMIRIGKQSVDQVKFFALWRVMFDTYEPGLDAATDPMPISARQLSLLKQLEAGHAFSVDVLCRLLVPSFDTMQATEEFRQVNQAFLECCETTSPRTGRSVLAMRASQAAQQFVSKPTPTDYADAEAILYAMTDGDPEDEGTGSGHDAQSASRNRNVEHAGGGLLPPSAAPPSLQRGLGSAPHYIDTLVDFIESVPFQSQYRGLPAGQVVHGWDARLNEYFWPNPRTGIVATKLTFAGFESRAKALMNALPAPWSSIQEAEAVQLATDIFRWGGVRGRTILPGEVRAVFESVLAGAKQGSARMNSGWTKVAAVASSALPPHQHQVIWDSRVSHSLINRLEHIFCAYYGAVPPALPRVGLPAIGWVPGRGGSRLNPAYSFAWPYGYGSWPAHLSGSRLVRQIRDRLNTVGQRSNWTVREVEMVLFMDGY